MMRSKVTKYVKVFALICMCFMIGNMKVQAADQTSGSWTFKYESSEVTITGYTGSSTSVVIPSTLNGYSVTKIGNAAFENSNIKSVTIPEGIKSIGKGAFRNCKYLANVYFNAKNCADFEGYSSDSYYTADRSVFYNAGCNSGGISVTFGNQVKKIPADMFATGLDKVENVYAHVTSVKMSTSIETIGKDAFFQCYDLKNVTWGTGIKTIGSCAFKKCESLVKVVIPTTTESIGNAAFNNCKLLKEIEFNAKNCADFDGYSSDSYYTADRSVFYNAGCNSGGISVTFGNQVKKIPADMFATGLDKVENVYAHVTSVKMSTSIETIGKDAFFQCYDLKNMTWGTGIKTIGSCAFKKCESLVKVVIPTTTESIGNAAFNNCKSLKEIEFNAKNCEDFDRYSSESYYTADRSVFYNAGCNSKSIKVTFGNAVKKIPAYMFSVGRDYNYGDSEYARITSVTIPSSVDTIGEDAFYCCYDLKNITIKRKNVTIESDAFANVPKSATIKCLRGGSVATFANSNGYKRVFLNSAISSITNTSSGIQLKWYKVSGASGYYVYRKAGTGSWKQVKKTTALNWTDKNITNGTKYQYKIYPYTSSGKGSVSATKTIARVKQVALSSVKNSASKKITVKWKKNAKASGYQIYYATNSKFNSKKSTSVSGAAKLSKTLTGLTKGKTYYVKVRAYKTVNGTKYYSAWSGTKKVKVSK